MNAKHYLRTLGLVLSVAVMAGCSPTTVVPSDAPAAGPTEAPTDIPALPPTERPTEVPTEVTLQVTDATDARDVALAYVDGNYGQHVPAAGVIWTEDDISKEGLVGASVFEYTAEAWVVTVSFPIVPLEATIYTVVAFNEATGFEWEGEIDAEGTVTELAMVEAPDVRVEGVSFSYDEAIAGEVVPSVVPASGDDEPDWAASPEHLEFAFDGYVLQGTFHQPRILVYPASELEAASNMGSAIIAAVRQSLEERPAVVPANSLLPGFNATRLVSTSAEYLDFRSGSGVRFLTQMAQAYFPINNTDLFYAFQGLTSDGQWYIVAVLPVSHPSLAADGSEIPGGDFSAFADDFETYAAEIAAQLDSEALDSFTPDLALLDAMMRSVRVDRT